MPGAAILLCAILIAKVLGAETVSIAGLHKPVEILRDRWGVPHIYAQTVEDLVFAQGYITATDRLFQIDLWRRIGTGKLAEVLGPAAVDRDKLARAVRFRGPMEQEWIAYGPDTKRRCERRLGLLCRQRHSLPLPVGRRLGRSFAH